MSWQDLSLIEKQAIVNRDEAAIKKRLRENIMSIDAPSVKMGLLSVAWKEDGEGLEMSSFSKGILYKYGIKAEWELGQEYGQKKYSIEPDPEKAFQYFEQAEKEEEPLAYYELAMCYADGRGTERNAIGNASRKIYKANEENIWVAYGDNSIATNIVNWTPLMIKELFNRQ